MQVLSAEEVTKWFEGLQDWKPESDYVHSDKNGLFYSHPEATCIDLEYPAKLERLPSLRIASRQSGTRTAISMEP